MHAVRHHFDQSVNIRQFSGACPIDGAFSLAAQPEGSSAGSSIMGTHQPREAQALSSAGGRAYSGGPRRSKKELVDTVRAPPEMGGYLDSGKMLNSLRQSDPGLPCVSPGLKCRGLFCDLNMRPRFPLTGFAVLRRTSFFMLRRAFRIYVSRPIKEHQVDDCGATSWFADRVKAAARGLSNS